MTDKKLIALITGANSGIGLELARQLLAKTSPTWHVLLGSRSIDKGQATIEHLTSYNLPETVELVHLDVNDDNTIIPAAADVQKAHDSIDLLVNNAAIAYTGPRTRDSMHASFDTNVVGPLRMAEAFAPLLSKSTSPYGPRIINISSRAGSTSVRLADKSTPIYDALFVEYRVSKATQNMLSVCMVWEFAKLGIKTFMYCPGFTESNLSPLAKVENGAKPVAEGARPVVDIIEGGGMGRRGCFWLRGGGGLVTDCGSTIMRTMFLADGADAMESDRLVVLVVILGRFEKSFWWI